MPRITADVSVTGGRAVDLSGSLTLSGGPGGLSAGPFPLDAATTIAPGSTGAATVTLDAQLPPGPWHAELTLTSGLLSHVASADLSFPDAGAAPAVAPADPGPDVALLVGWGAVGVLVLLTAFLLVRRGRRRRRGDLRATDAAAGSSPVGRSPVGR